VALGSQARLEEGGSDRDMTADALARSMIRQSRQRFNLLRYAQAERAYHVVVRESQEVVELALKGILRLAGIEPPKIHDVGGLIKEYAEKLKEGGLEQIDEIVRISKTLRKEREISFYGDVDFLPDESYQEEEGIEAMRGAETCVLAAEKFLSE